MKSVRILFLTGGIAIWLAGCAVGGFDFTGGSSASAPAAQPAVAGPQAAAEPATQNVAVQPPAAPALVARTPSRQLPAGRATRAPPAPPPEVAADEEPMTTTHAREICWMATEENPKIKRDMDAKIKFVEKCVDEKLRSAGQ
jgi:hypothetical protein